MATEEEQEAMEDDDWPETQAAIEELQRGAACIPVKQVFDELHKNLY